MEGFIKPERITVEDSEYIQSLINASLTKDLCDNEEICEYCHGTGMVIVDNPYGLESDCNGIRFPYRHQSISFCPHCYNGIVHRCPLCGELMERGAAETSL